MKEPGGVRLLSCSRKDQRCNEIKREKTRNEWRSVSKKKKKKKAGEKRQEVECRNILAKKFIVHVHTEKRR
jgi:hypothetical protein